MIFQIPNKAFVCGVVAAAFFAVLPAFGEQYRLVTGVNVGKYPDFPRSVSPLPGSGFSAAGTFYDGQRLGGAVAGPDVSWQGAGTPLFPPNNVGALSFFFRRGSIPLFANHVVPFMGIDFLGGPLIDLDGDLNNGTRSLVPVAGHTPIAIPGSSSHVDLTFDFLGGSVTLAAIDLTGTNEGGPGVNAGASTTVNVLADAALNGGAPGPVNPAFDTRVGTLTPFGGTGGTLVGVYRITDLQAEFWYDSIDPASSSPDQLGTFQQLYRFRGWLVKRNPSTSQFPTLAGQGLGTTLWPGINTTETCPPVDPCPTFNRAFDIGFGPTAEIHDGNSTDQYSLPGPANNGVALTGFGGDIGAYFDSVVVPQLAADVFSFVYLESMGLGINNTGDPVFGNTNGYDAVIVAAASAPAPIVGDVNGDGVVNAADAAALAGAVRNPSALTPAEFGRADVNSDLHVNGLDIQAFLNILL